MRLKTLSLSYSEKLHLQKDFIKVFKKGLKFDNKAIKIVAYKNEGRRIRRLGLVTPRKVGTAVIRNRTKRRLREIFRTNKHSLEPGLDLIFISKPETASLDYGSLKKIILSSLESAGLYSGPR